MERAEEQGVFVWLDMEDHETTDATLDAFEHHAREYEEVGVCIQSNLKRTGEDLARLADLPGKVRLVKGGYTPQSRLRIRTASASTRSFGRTSGTCSSTSRTASQSAATIRR